MQVLANSTVAIAGTAWGHNYSQIKIFHNYLLSTLFFKEKNVHFLRKCYDWYHQIYKAI